MDGLIFFAFLVLAGTFVIIRARSRRGRERAAQAAIERRRAKKRRIEECGEVVRFFANHLGYLAREQVSRNELAAWIESGITADELADRLWQACEMAQGLFLGEHLLGETQLPVLVPESLRARHIYIVGKSGSGKTTLLRNLILQDFETGRGLAVLAPEAEMLRDELLPLIPEHRWNDVVFVDPADTERPVPFNPLHLETGEDLDLKVDETFTILQRVYEDDGGGSAPRMEQILRQGLYLLMRIPGTTLLDFDRLLDRQDNSFRVWAVTQVADPETERFWLHTYPAYPKDAHLPLVNRLGRFLRPRVVRNLLCAPGCISVRSAMDEGKVLLFNLSDGLLGATNAELIGQLVVAKLQTAAMSRADTHKGNRRPFSVYLDEFQTFCGVASASYERILSRARKYGLSLVLAHQQTGQIPEHLMRDILGNVATVVAFAVGASDARRLSREMIGEIDGEPTPLDERELLSLRVGEAWCRIGGNVVFLHTPSAPQDGPAHVREEVVRRSRLSFGAEKQAPILVPVPTAISQSPAVISPAARAEVQAETTEESGPQEVRISRLPWKKSDRPSAPVVTLPTPGRGGSQHKYLQELMKRWAESREWRATIEEQILDGLGSIDVALRMGEQAVACEIAVTTSPEHEIGNIQKCIAAGFGRIVVISPEKKTLKKIRQMSSTELSEEELARVSFCTPEEAFTALEQVEAETAGGSRTVHGYKVKIKYEAMESREKAARRQAVSSVIARAMKRLGR